MADHNLANIRTLLTEGFTASELRRFCYDDSDFRPVYEELAEYSGKSEIIQKLIEYAEHKDLLDSLLAWAKKSTSEKYKKHQPYDSSSARGEVTKSRPPITDVLLVIAGIVALPVAIIELINYSVQQPIIALLAALVIAGLLSVWLVHFRKIEPTKILFAWLVLMGITLALVLLPKTITVQGFIKDIFGEVVKNEEVWLFDNSNLGHITKTNIEGQYQFIDLPSGSYKIRVRGIEVSGQMGGISVLGRQVQQDITVPEVTPTPTFSPAPTVTLTPSPTHSLTTEPITTTPTIVTPINVTAVPPSFDYKVQVKVQNTNENISDAMVTIQVSGKAPLTARTSSNSGVSIFIDAVYFGQPGELIVKADGYQDYRTIVDLVEGSLPEVIALEKLPTPPLKHQMRVQVKDISTDVQGAVVAIIVDSSVIFSGTTDVSGTVTISIVASYVGQSGELVVEAANYQDYRQTINLTEDTLPDFILLKKSLPLSPPISGKLAIPLALDGNFIVYIVDTSGNLFGTVDLARQPDFTKDGTWLIVNGDGGPWDKLRFITQIGDKQGKNIGDSGLGGHSHPFWSPNGMQLIYDDNTIAGDDWRMFIRRNLNETTGPGEELATAIGPIGPILGQNPLWTTGDWFIFRGCRTWANQGGDCGIWKMQGNLGNPVKLTDNVNHILTDVVGNIVVYNSDEAGNWNVYTLNINTKMTNQLTFDPMPESLATLSPNGYWVAYLADQGGQLAVWRVSVSGSPPQKMFDIPKAWGNLTPDGWYNEKLSWGEN